MIIGQKDKDLIRDLQLELKAEKALTKDLRIKLDNFSRLSDEHKIDLLLEQLKTSNEKTEELINIVKAIINRFGKREIIISNDEILKAKSLGLIKQQEYLGCDYIYRIVDEKEVIKSYKGGITNE